MAVLLSLFLFNVMLIKRARSDFNSPVSLSKNQHNNNYLYFGYPITNKQFYCACSGRILIQLL